MSEMEPAVYSGEMAGCDECGVGPEDECVPDCPWVAAAEDAASTRPPPPARLVDILKFDPFVPEDLIP